MKIVYVGGYGRSGSTLLDATLGSLPGVVGGGELSNLWEHVEADGVCSTGEKFTESAYWQEVFGKFGARYGAYQPAELQRITREGDYGIPNMEQTARHHALWKPLAEEMMAGLNADAMVDSSKSTRMTTLRAVQYHKMGFDVRMIQMVRHPLAVMVSQIYDQPKLEAFDAAVKAARAEHPEMPMDQLLKSKGLDKNSAKLPLGPYRALWGWLQANKLVERQCQELNIPRMVLRHDQFAQDPAFWMAKIGEFAEIDVQPALDRIEAGEGFGGGVGVSGNRMRRQGLIKIRPDSMKWRNEAGPLVKLTCNVFGMGLARSYGFE